MVMTSHGRNKNLDDEIIKKNQEKANNSLSYRFAAIKNDCGVFVKTNVWCQNQCLPPKTDHELTHNV